MGLAAASKAGLIHRDVKPSNLVRLSDGRVKVTDFGLAKPVDPGAEPALTAMGVVVGTPDYIAPEQARGEAIDERVDIYALGGTLYFLLTGIPPFRTGKPAEDKYLKVVARHLRNPAPDAAVTNPSVDRELAGLTRAMMAKKAPERPTYDDLVQQLSAIVARLDPGAVPMLVSASRERSRPFSLPPEESVPDHSATINDSQLDVPPPRAFPGWLVLFTLAAIATFVAGLVVYMRKGDATASTSSQGSGSAVATIDAGATPGSGSNAKPSVPDGMLLVKKADGTTFLADTAPVSLADYKAVFAKHEQQGKATDPVIDLSYTEAKSYAMTRGRRLLTPEEWDAASVTPGFVVAGKSILEWVESPDEKKRIAKQHGKTETRPDAKQKDVTFRTGKSP
jgi:serine/threonine protein kinase